MARKLLPLIFILAFQFSLAQNKRANIWYFGTLAGIDFNSGSAVSINNSALTTGEGTAVMCDTSGTLLFYTDGLTIWGNTHVPMPNGFGLAGGSSSSQSALIVPDPGNTVLYYVFTVQSDATGGLSYSIVDMTLNGGLGDVTVKNAALLAFTGEKVTGFQKPGTNDIWIVTHEWGTADFYSYLLTAAGLQVPVVSTSGQVHSGSGNAIGYMKISPAGDKLAVAVSRNNNFELFDFDAATGIVSNPIILPATFYTYGIEFSRDGKILYAAEFSNKIYQFDLTLGSAAAIIASQLLILPTPVGLEIGSLQMAPDGRIYVCKNGVPFTGVINSPGTLGQGCNYVDNGFSIAPNNGQEGLPNFIQSIFAEAPAMPVALFNTPDNHICPGTCTDFTNLSVNGVTYLWSFPGANPSTSTDVNPTNICYNSPGSYTVALITTNANGSDTLTMNNFITVYPNPPPQGIAQSGDTLYANQGANSYQWYYGGNLIPGATEYYYVAQAGGDYNVVATDANGCEVEAAIFDVVAALPYLDDAGIQLLYPNPVRDQLTVNFMGTGITQEASVVILTVLGLEAIHVPPAAAGKVNIDVSGLSKGMYFIQIAASGKFYRSKFSKQ
jgi:hypothetical protein